MTDKELLELAAKAAGIESKWREVIRSRIAEFKTIKHTKHSGFYVGNKEWNPLTDDGDALRLAVRLEMDIQHRVVGKNRIEIVVPGNKFEFLREGGDDPYAATRRAIVRAAAEIGRKQ